MNLNLSLFDLLIIVGMITGVICSILLLKKADQKSANRFLALGILGFVWLNTKLLLHSFDLWEIHGIGFFPNAIELALPPLFYFYVISIVKPQFQFTSKHWLHFVPFLLSQSYAIVVYICTLQTRLMAEKQGIASLWYFDEIKSLDEYLTLISAVCYLYAAYKPVEDYKKWWLKHTGSLSFPEIGFLKNLTIGFLFIPLYTLLNLILNQFLSEPHGWRWQLSHLIIAVMVYYMGLVGYKNSDLISEDFLGKHASNSPKLNGSTDPTILAKLDAAIRTEKIHLNPQLSLQGLARHLAINESSLSNTINAHYQKNFRTLINEYRVEEVKKRLLSEGLDKLSLLGLAKECGFNSEASFYRIFKLLTGMTPKQFLATQNSA